MTNFGGGPMSYVPKDSKLSSVKIKLDSKEEKGIEVKVYKFIKVSE
jgi:hypothetical protein